jgi:four helix bundle protein
MAGQPRDLVQRTCGFAQRIRRFVNLLPGSVADFEDGKQLVRSSGSVAANYPAAQEAFS